MKKTKMKNGLISNFFGGRKAQKLSTSSSPHPNEPQVEVINQIPPIQEETNNEEPPFIPSQEAPQNEKVSSDEEYVYDVDLLPHDPAKRLPISSYPPNDQDKIRRGFIAKGPCRLRSHSFPPIDIGMLTPCARKFKSEWYANYHWLEYSVSKDAAFCFVCYLFRDKTNHIGGDTFVSGGFRGWNRAHERFGRHVGTSLDSAHKQAQEKYDFFINPKSSIVENLNKTSNEVSVL
ncbi:hypothetical protein RND81_14G080300 [Saponaria officinalis]|uniref:TTF-type domain-containing protein n=1 Tax=Saponaria officinalis TaxID=3572 RepID=A0AAW1GMS1_SAPOF